MPFEPSGLNLAQVANMNRCAANSGTPREFLCCRMIVSPFLQAAALYHPATDQSGHIQPFLLGFSTGENMTRFTIIGCCGAWEVEPCMVLHWISRRCFSFRRCWRIKRERNNQTISGKVQTSALCSVFLSLAVLSGKARQIGPCCAAKERAVVFLHVSWCFLILLLSC